MKQVILNIDDSKYRFFMDLIKNFDFVSVKKEDEAKKQAIKQIAEGMQAAILAGKGKLKTRSAKDFLNEL